MGINRSREKVRDGYLGDLPEEVRIKVMNIHKLIKRTVDELIDNSIYRDLKSSRWAMSCIDEFVTMPNDKSDVGSIRVYKSGKSYRCMIQMTGHFTNHEYGWIEELLHDFIGNVFSSVRPKVRREFDLTMTNEGKNGNSYEGFDVFTDKKTAQEIWESLEDRKTKTVMESTDDIFEIEVSEDLSDYYEFFNESGLSYDTYFYEKSHGKLKYSFRMAVNVKNGHMIKIIFDLNPKSVYQIGDHTRQSDRNFDKDNKTIRNIQKKGSTDFSSIGLVKAIVDLDTRENLKEVTTIGIIGNTGTRFNVPEKYIDSKLGDEAYEFDAYPVSVREKIARELNLNPKDAITFKVGKKEEVPSYKSTRSANSVLTVYNNEFRASGRGVERKKDYRHISRSKLDEYNSTNKHVKTRLKEIESEYNKLKGKLKDDSKLEEEAQYFEKLFSKVKKKVESQKDENFGQVVGDSRYIESFKDLDNELSYIRSLIRKIEKKNGAIKESASNNTPEYNVDMNEKQAKATLRTLSQSIINDVANKKNYKVSQYTANIYANIITKNLLPIWAKGFRKFSITLDSYQSFPTFEFRVPKMTQDFVSRFIDGKESINGFIHREPEIKVKMSPHIFHTMKNPDDAFAFFKLAIQYYDQKLDKLSISLMSEVRKLGYSMRHLIKTTKLSGLVTYPISLLFVFDDVQMGNRDTFRISKEDIATVNKFIRGIAINYAAPEKEKGKIIEDVKKMIETLHEACEFNDNTSDMKYLPEAIQKYYNGEFKNLIEEAEYNFAYENTDLEWERCQENYQLKYYQEKFGVKKLKKIPADIVAYITIEAESIRDANDKMMISSYCLSKIEIVEWYIELLTVGSKKYVVPHTKPYLENMRTQLLACFKKIMDTPIPKPGSNRPIIDIQYPKGYEG